MSCSDGKPRKSLLPRHLPPIKIDIVDEQRYDTAGDYFETPTGWRFAISRQRSIDDEFLILVHELVEWYLTQKHGIPEPDITSFDITAMKRGSRDPGSEPDAPYRDEHSDAIDIEDRVSHQL